MNCNRIVIDSHLSRISIDNSTIFLLNIKQAVYECVLNTKNSNFEFCYKLATIILKHGFDAKVTKLSMKRKLPFC